MALIDRWLEDFRQGWINGEVDKVLNLFSQDVDYYETPSKKLEYSELRSEWENVKDQKNIQLYTEVFSRAANRYTVKWRLSYRKNGRKKELGGVYLIVLGDEGLCTEFHQYCQSE